MCGTRFTFQFTSSVETCGKESALLRVAKALFDGERNEFQKGDEELAVHGFNANTSRRKNKQYHIALCIVLCTETYNSR